MSAGHDHGHAHGGPGADSRLLEVLDQLQACLAEHFEVSIEHSTFELEMGAHADHEAAAHA